MTEEPLGNHAQFIRGVTFKPTDKCEVGKRDSLVCLRTANVQQTLDESDLIAIPANIVKNPEKLVRLGDILVSSANSWNLVGRCCRVESLRHPSAAGGFISILRADPSRLDPSYLYRWFASDHTQATVRSLGNQTTNISNLDHKRTLSLRIPLPPLPEQKRIAAILDAADALRAKRRESIEQLDSLVQATFLEMLGDPVTNPKKWPETSLVSLCRSEDDMRCGPFGTQLHQNEFAHAGVPLWGIKHVNAGFSLGTDEFVTHGKAKQLATYCIRAGDLVMTRKGTIGNCHVYPSHLCEGVMHSDLLRIRLNVSRANPDFLSAQLKYSAGVQHQLRAMSPGAVMPGINVSKLKNLRVLSPSLDLQTRFASIVESIEHQKATLKAHLAELDALFSSLQSRAFNGELVA